MKSGTHLGLVGPDIVSTFRSDYLLTDSSYAFKVTSRKLWFNYKMCNRQTSVFLSYKPRNGQRLCDLTSWSRENNLFRIV